MLNAYQNKNQSNSRLEIIILPPTPTKTNYPSIFFLKRLFFTSCLNFIMPLLRGMYSEER